MGHTYFKSLFIPPIVYIFKDDHLIYYIEIIGHCIYKEKQLNKQQSIYTNYK